MEQLDRADVFIGLTGTLIQNNLHEFWWIMNVMQPGVLGTDKAFIVSNSRKKTISCRMPLGT